MFFVGPSGVGRAIWAKLSATKPAAGPRSTLPKIICDRYERASTIITSKRDFAEWPAVFSNPLMGSAAMDRLVHRGVKLVIEGKSYRMDNFLKRSKRTSAPTTKTKR